MTQTTVFAFKFKKDIWSPSRARTWLRKHGHRVSELHEDDGTFSLVQRPRSDFGPTLTQKAHSPSHPGVFEVRGVLKSDVGKHAKTGHKKAASKKNPGGVRHDLGKAQLRWERWEWEKQGRRGLRYGIGLNGENKGASVILLEVLKVSDKEWRWEVYPKNDYAELLPSAYQHPISGSAASKALAVNAVQTAVGLKSKAKKPAKKRSKKAAAKPKKVAKKRTKSTTAGHKKVVRKKTAKRKKVAGKTTTKRKKVGKKRTARAGKKKATKRAAAPTFKPGELVGVLDKRGGKVSHWAHVVSVAGRMVVIRSNGTQRAVKATHLLAVPKKA